MGASGRPGRSFLMQGKGALTHHQPGAGGGTACGSRAPSGGGSAGGCPSLPSIYQQTPTAACASDAAASMHWGLGGHQPPTSCTGYIPVHCLPLQSAYIIGVESLLQW